MAYFEFNTLTPSNFVNRRRELTTLTDEIKLAASGAGHLRLEISGPRRIGKSEFLKKVVAEVQADPEANQEGSEILIIYKDVQSERDLGNFFDRIGDAILQETKPKTHRAKEMTASAARILSALVPPSVEMGGATLNINREGMRPLTWQEKGNRFFAAIKEYGPRLVLIIDEIGFIRDCPVDDVEKGAFIAYLRSKFSEADCQIILCSSFNLFRILREYDAQNYADWDRFLRHFPITNFTKEQTVDELLLPNFATHGFNLDQTELRKVCTFIAQLTNGHVNTTQAIGKLLTQEFRKDPVDLTLLHRHLIDTLLPDLILRDRQRILKQLVDKEALGPEHEALKAGLRALSLAPHPTMPREVTRLLGSEEHRSLLTELNYISQGQDEAYYFEYPFLRHYLMGVDYATRIKDEWNELWQTVS